MFNVDQLVKVVPLTVHEDSRGSLYEVFRSDDESFVTFGQNYMVRSRKGAVRAFHFHEFLIDHFTVVSGAAKFCFFSLPVDRDMIPPDEDIPKMNDFLRDLDDVYIDCGYDCVRDESTYDHLFTPYMDPWFKTVIATAEQPKRIDVPAGVAHGWCALEDNTILLSTGSETYCAEDPDEYRLPWNLFGADIWGIENK